MQHSNVNVLHEKRHGDRHSPSYANSTLPISTRKVKKVVDGARPGYRELLTKHLGRREYGEAPKGYDLLGNIAIVAVPERLKKKGRVIAEIIMQIHPNVETVLAKAGAVSGRYRTRKFRHILGKRNYTAVYKENGCVFRFDVRKTFFSNRLSHERERIADLSHAHGKETVAVLFAGVAPFSIEIAKANPKAEVLSVELNRSAHEMALENIKLNKTENVTAVNADVKKLASSGEYSGKADRIIAPLPASSLSFLDSIARIAKKKAIVHLYSFADADRGEKEVAEKVREHALKNGYSIKVVGSRIVRPYSARQAEIALDYEMTKY